VRYYLIRHPRPSVGSGVCYGATDLALAENPELIADTLRKLLPAAAPLYSSPLRRCRALAQCIHPEPRIDERLRELNFGTWEMRSWEQIDRAALDAWAADPLNFAPPGGESPAELIRRVGDFHTSVSAATDGDVIVVCHAGTIKAFAHLLQARALSEWLALSPAHGSCTVMEVCPGLPRGAQSA
jgi:alpha-ribazole phosphatase